MRIMIEDASNGYILSEATEEPTCGEDGEADYDDIVELTVIEEKGTEEETITDLLYAIAEKIGVNYDKYSKENLNITWDKPGHKIE